MDCAAIEVAGIEKWHGAALGCFAKRFLEAKIHDAPSRDGHTQRGKAGAKAVHGFLGSGVAGRGGDVDELFGVVRVDDLGEREGRLGNSSAMLAAAAGDGQFARLVLPLHRVEDDVLL